MVRPGVLCPLRDRRGSVAVMVALLLLPVLGAAALATDLSMWMLERHRLQIAADAAAMAASMQLSNKVMQLTAPSSLTTLVGNEARAATGGGTLIGTLNAPAIQVAADFSAVTVTLTSRADTFFANAVMATPVTLSATAKAGVQAASPCLLALNLTAAWAITAGGSSGAGTITANLCGIFADSLAVNAIYVNSATITAQSIGTQGGVQLSNSGSNKVTGAITANATLVADPVGSSYTLPTPAACTPANTNQTFSAWQATPYVLQPGTYCGSTFIGGNGMTQILQSGTYIFTGDLTINNANITQASGVTLIMMGTASHPAAGTLNYINNAGVTMSAPRSGAMGDQTGNSGNYGMLFWQVCPPGAPPGANVNGPVNFTNGSGGTLNAAGIIYAPCGAMTVANNMTIQAMNNANFSVVANTIAVSQSANLTLSPGATSAANRPSLMQ